MKYFVLFIFILAAITFKISSDNSESLANADIEESSGDVDEKYQKIDLSRITIKGFGEKTPQPEDKNPPIDQNNADSPPPEPIDFYSGENQQESEINEELHDSRYSKEGDEAYRPDVDTNEGDNAMETLRKKMKSEHDKKMKRIK